MSNEKKSEQLGMSYGKAGNMLRKSIMFHLVHKCGLGSCHQCGELIDNIDNFSIEHIEPWLDSENPVELYFDIENISFSHTTCNVNARRRFTQNRVVGATGYRGVIFNNDKAKSNFKYRSNIKKDGKLIFNGYYNDVIEGAKAYDKRALELHGDKAITNKSLGLL